MLHQLRFLTVFFCLPLHFCACAKLFFIERLINYIVYCLSWSWIRAVCNISLRRKCLHASGLGGYGENKKITNHYKQNSCWSTHITAGMLQNIHAEKSLSYYEISWLCKEEIDEMVAKVKLFTYYNLISKHYKAIRRETQTLTRRSP